MDQLLEMIEKAYGAALALQVSPNQMMLLHSLKKRLREALCDLLILELRQKQQVLPPDAYFVAWPIKMR